MNKKNKREFLKKYLYLFVGCFISAFAFNVFFLKYNIVCFGISGLSIVLKEFGVPSTLFISISSVVLLIISFIFLGYKKTKNSIVGSLLFPLCVWLTEPFINIINLNTSELLLIAIFGAVISGIGYGLVFREGFTTGGTDIINQIASKYLKMSVGNAMIIVDGLVVLSGKLVFSWEIVMCGLIVLYIITVLVDKVILGISSSKAFYIITDKEKEVKEYLLSLNKSGVTVIDAKGGYTDKKKKMLLCVISTRKYFIVKEVIKKIDKDVFFLVTDAYEVSERSTINEVV